MQATLKNATTFEDFDIASHQTIYRSFPAGTEVRDCLSAGNGSRVRLVAPVGMVGWIASVHQSQLSR